MSTPIRRQYLRIKAQHPDAIVLFRLGDFYETFDDDARTVARELEITLTSKPMGKDLRVPLAGIPYHALDSYLGRLIGRGHKVAICEQLSDPRQSRGLVERDVVRVVTPGTVLEPHLLATAANNYLAALVISGDWAGLAHIDITTSEFATTQLPINRVGAELERLRPAELLVPKGAETTLPDVEGRATTPVEATWFDPGAAEESLLLQLKAVTLDGYGCAGQPMAVAAAGAIIRYLGETQKGSLAQIDRLSAYSTESYMVLDSQTRRNLEIAQGLGGGSSLLAVLDRTVTPMGGRLLKRWLGQPLLECDEVLQRQEAVAVFHGSALLQARVQRHLGEMSDLERLVNRVRSYLATPREFVALRRSLEALDPLREAVASEGREELGGLVSGLRPCPEAVALIAAAIAESPPAALAEGGVIRPGFSPELDELRSASRNARQYLAGLEQQERERSGIRSLKVGYNRVFGYYIEVSKANLPQVPDDYIRKQTLVGAERFYTPQLKEYEALILNAQERAQELESSLFRQVCGQLAMYADGVLETAACVAQADVLCGLAEVAARNGYVRPQVSEGASIKIRDGRHPVVELSLHDSSFVPNDCDLSNGDAQIAILTGPNMSGKSTYLRQVALIVLLAQIGSFVPAAEAQIGLVDRIFTRIGAQDDLAAGRSTFMLEMIETAAILNQATSRSLVILDELGRGTSTYDGLSIARSVVEYMHNNPTLGAKTLFATHYHELVELAGYLPRVRNYSFAVTEEEGKVVFLRRVVPGGADKSYGIHVAQLAGLPPAVTRRAQDLLSELERDHRGPKAQVPRAGRASRQPPAEQISLFAQPSPLLEELAQLDINSLTPLEALNKLYELQKRAEIPWQDRQA